jgi:hypothetical protein
LRFGEGIGFGEGATEAVPVPVGGVGAGDSVPLDREDSTGAVVAEAFEAEGLTEADNGEGEVDSVDEALLSEPGKIVWSGLLLSAKFRIAIPIGRRLRSHRGEERGLKGRATIGGPLRKEVRSILGADAI